MVTVRRIAPGEYAGSPAAAVSAITAAVMVGDGQSPLDESALLHLSHHGLHEASLWVTDDGFALLRTHAHPHDAAQTHDHDATHPHAAVAAVAAVAAHNHVLRHELDLAVAPAGRRTGQGRALLDAALAALRHDAEVTAWSHVDHPGAAALAAATGWRRARELLVLTLTTTSALSARHKRPLSAPQAPSRHATSALSATEGGITIRTWQDSDRDELLRVNAAAFVHHPEQGAMGAAHLAERMAEPWFDPAGLLVAERDSRLVGFHWTKVHPNGHGEVYVLAVDPAAQGTGLGRSLTAAGLRHLADVGCSRIHLYVEADNAPALGLYTRLGFVRDHAHVQYARP